MTWLAIGVTAWVASGVIAALGMSWSIRASVREDREVAALDAIYELPAFDEGIHAR